MQVYAIFFAPFLIQKQSLHVNVNTLWNGKTGKIAFGRKQLECFDQDLNLRYLSNLLFCTNAILLQFIKVVATNCEEIKSVCDTRWYKNRTVIGLCSEEREGKACRSSILAHSLRAIAGTLILSCCAAWAHQMFLQSTLAIPLTPKDIWPQPRRLKMNFQKNYADLHL